MHDCDGGDGVDVCGRHEEVFSESMNDIGGGVEPENILPLLKSIFPPNFDASSLRFATSTSASAMPSPSSFLIISSSASSAPSLLLVVPLLDSHAPLGRMHRIMLNATTTSRQPPTVHLALSPRRR
uniref:Uncharacterized protein n=1 Tax=Oryza nivara TaxID=4536 RepID=A0A0E0IGQ3_ORYNI